MVKRKLRFLATGDIHSDINLVNAIEQYTNMEDIDFVIFTGDLSDKKQDFGKLLGVFKDKRIFMVPGNHESKKGLEALKKHYKVHLIGNSPIVFGEDLAIFGSNYINVGPYGLEEQSVFENIVQNFDAIKDTKFKIHLSHVPPVGTKIGDASPFFPFIGGSDAVRVFLENFEPDVTFVGHIHESSGLEEIVNKTNVINIGRTFKVFEFDRDKHKLSEMKPKSKKKNLKTEV